MATVAMMMTKMMSVGLDVGLGLGLGLVLGVGLGEHLKSGMLLDMCLGDWSLAPNKIPNKYH